MDVVHREEAGRRGCLGYWLLGISRAKSAFHPKNPPDSTAIALESARLCPEARADLMNARKSSAFGLNFGPTGRE
jgi:hypothetical protein